MEKIWIYNTLSGNKEEFCPQEPKKVRMYVCGITPYDECHLGHARCYIFFDVVRRFLRAAGFQVTFVQNFTDIDDKILARAKSLNQSWNLLANHYIEDYFQKMESLNIEHADAYPRVTEFIPEIVAFIEKLIEKGAAYIVEEDVYFAVRKFPGYGKLSKRSLEEMEAGARLEVDVRKRDPLDFALWKKAKRDEPAWDSPWGAGRPGWHIECSVMSANHLGESFDIHGGGQDLIFPHHENEIAQSESISGKIFARYWIHNGFVTVNRKKMSKSLGNFFSLREIFEKFSPEVVRFFLLSRHHRSPLDFSDDLLFQAQNAYHTLQEANDLCIFLLSGTNQEGSVPVLEEWKSEFFHALCDDFNTEKAIAVLFELRREIRSFAHPGSLEWLKKASATLRFLCTDILGIKLTTKLESGSLQELKKKLQERNHYREKKEWSKADAIRREFEQARLAIEDTPFGSILKTKPS